MESQLQILYDSVEKSMSQFTELRLTLKTMAPAPTQSAVLDLASSVSNSLTCCLVDLRTQIRHQHQRQEKEPVSKMEESSSLIFSCSCNHDDESITGGSGCVHRTAIADRVIDRAFDKHKGVLREALKEAEAELAKFKSGAMVQQLQRRIDDLELKLRERANNNNTNLNRPESVSFSTNSQNVVIGGEIDEMIAAFKKRCEERKAQEDKSVDEQQRHHSQGDGSDEDEEEEEDENDDALERQQEERRLFVEASLNKFSVMAQAMSTELDVQLRRKLDLFTSSCVAAQHLSSMRWQRELDTLHTKIRKLNLEKESASSVRQQQQSFLPPIATVAAAAAAAPDVPIQMMTTPRSSRANGKTLDIKQKPLHPPQQQLHPLLQLHQQLQQLPAPPPPLAASSSAIGLRRRVVK